MPCAARIRLPRRVLAGDQIRERRLLDHDAQRAGEPGQHAQRLHHADALVQQQPREDKDRGGLEQDQDAAVAGGGRAQPPDAEQQRQRVAQHADQREAHEFAPVEVPAQPAARREPQHHARHGDEIAQQDHGRRRQARERELLSEIGRPANDVGDDDEDDGAAHRRRNCSGDMMRAPSWRDLPVTSRSRLTTQTARALAAP